MTPGGGGGGGGGGVNEIHSQLFFNLHEYSFQANDGNSFPIKGLMLCILLAGAYEHHS